MLMKIRIASYVATIVGLALFVLGTTLNIVVAKQQLFTLPLIIAGSIGIIFGLGVRFFFNIRLHIGNIERQLKSVQSAVTVSKIRTIQPVFFGRHAVEADFIELVAEIIRRGSVSSVLELGSGTTTHYIATLIPCAKDGGVLLSLEENSAWAQLVKSEIDIQGIDKPHDLKALVNIVHAPLVPYRDSNLLFYDLRSVSNWHCGKTGNFDLIVIDGPGDVCYRRPAFDALRAVISDSTVMILDDGNHPHIRETVQLWLKKEPSLSARYYDTVKGSWVIFQPEGNLEMSVPFP